jgi:hypothetical protein
MLTNIRALTQKSIKVIDASTESIEVVARTKHLLASYISPPPVDHSDANASSSNLTQ